MTVSAMNAGLTAVNFPANSRTMSATCDFAALRARSLPMPSFSSFAAFASRLSTASIFISALTGLTSVSGYIRAAPGMGLRKLVVKSASAFLTSASGFLPFLIRSILLSTSFSITAGIDRYSWNPLISTRAVPLTEIFTSWRMVPMPRLRPGTLRRIVPIFAATSLHSSASLMSGAVAISMRGMPSRERL